MEKKLHIVILTTANIHGQLELLSILYFVRPIFQKMVRMKVTGCSLTAVDRSGTQVSQIISHLKQEKYVHQWVEEDWICVEFQYMFLSRKLKSMKYEWESILFIAPETPFS